MYNKVIAIDLETSGADPYSDHIIEIGAALWDNGVIVDRFAEFVKCPVALSPGIVKLTGITPAMLEDARDLNAVLADFLEFLPDKTMCIAHNAAFDRGFLRAASKDRFRHTVVDTVELSRICYPDLPSHSLGFLAETLELPRSDAHRALSDCETLLGLWEKLLARLREIPLSVVTEMNYLLAGHNRHPYRDIFRLLEAELLAQNFGATPAPLETLYREGKLNFNLRELPDEPPKEIDRDGISGLFGKSGAFAEKLPGFELREGQAEMVASVVDAMNQDKHLLVEAGTGIGKSLAYLAPAVIMATTNDSPVVISTNTKNLQSQLFDKDLPLLKKVLGIDFKAALIKGRRNYLCIRKLLYVLRQASQELSQDDKMRVLNVLPWSVWSETGDISENIIFGRPGFNSVWAKMSTVGNDCLGKGCKHQKRCFLRKARAKAQEADVVIANHSLVFSEMNLKSPALPPHRHLIFDEAHNLEDAATSHLSVEVSLPNIGFALGRLYRPGKGKQNGTGLLPSIGNQLNSGNCKADDDIAKQALEHIEASQQALEGVSPELKTFFGAMEDILGSRNDGGPMRFYADRRVPAIWEPLEQSKTALISAIAGVMRPLEALSGALKEMEPGDILYQKDFLRDLESAIGWFREITENAEFVLAADNDEYVFWIERAPAKQGGARAVAAPVKVGPLLYDQVYAKKSTVVFCSATLSVKNNFGFLKGRLGVNLIEPDRLIELNAGTPFDYSKQCLMAVPSFLPEPGDRGRNYAQEFGILLSEVFRRTNGRAMALFTSYDMLKKTSELLDKEMLGDGITVLAQGKSGSRESMTATFKRDIHSVLLGTHSFWEGVDVVGEALSCLAIARLPFAVFTDPIIQARCEVVEAEGQNAFMGYSLPSAVIRFRQGFGRLIRHKTDRGVVIVADRRMVSKRYGKWFQDSVDTPTETFSDREEFLNAIEEFLGA